MATSTKTSRLDDARARMYHDLVFESAECVFGQKGFEHATMQDIAGEAGISLKTLYAVFPGKQELYDDIQRVRGRAFMDRVAAAIDGEAGPLDQLGQAVAAYVSFLFEHRHWLRIHMQSRVSWGMRPSEQYAVDYWEEGLTAFADILGTGGESGLFYPTDAMQASALVQAILQVQVGQAIGSDADDPQQTAEEIMVQLQRLLCPPH
jgi:AcrR family transcriptional regulator